MKNMFTLHFVYTEKTIQQIQHTAQTKRFLVSKKFDLSDPTFNSFFLLIQFLLYLFGILSSFKKRVTMASLSAWASIKSCSAFLFQKDSHVCEKLRCISPHCESVWPTVSLNFRSLCAGKTTDIFLNLLWLFWGAIFFHHIWS